jgi:hypothetical protein
MAILSPKAVTSLVSKDGHVVTNYHVIKTGSFADESSYGHLSRRFIE